MSLTKNLCYQQALITVRFNIISPVSQRLEWLFDPALCCMAPNIPPLCDNVLMPDQSKDQNYKLLFDACTVDIQQLCITLDSGHLAIQYKQNFPNKPNLSMKNTLLRSERSYQKISTEVR